MLDKPRDHKPKMTFKQFERKLMRFSAKLEKSERRMKEIFTKAENMLDDINGILYSAEEILEEVGDAKH
jgi:hypothetical protein